MKKFILILLVFMILLTSSLTGKKVAVITEVLKPSSITIDENLYINEGTTIYIYDKTTYKFISKFGKAGEGPQEFKIFAAIIPQQDNLLINSFGKISFFTKKGYFLKEIKCNAGNSFLFWPLEKGYVGRGSAVEKKISYHTINLYDKELKKIKEIYRCENFNQIRGKGKIYWPPRRPSYQTYKNKVIIVGKPGFIIDVVDHTGKPLFNINEKDYAKRKFSKEDIEIHQGYLKRTYKENYERAKQFIEFKEYFPEIAQVFIDQGKIYALTWKFAHDKFEMFEYDLDGKFLDKFYAPIKLTDVLTPFPMGIKDGKLYQLIETEDEEWELHITNLKGK